jgi:hypothetical protein
MMEDDLYEWSKASLTPSNKLTPGVKSVKRRGGRFSGGFSPSQEDNQFFQNPMRKSSGTDLFSKNSSFNDDDFAKLKAGINPERPVNERRSLQNIQGRGSGGHESAGRKSAKRERKRQLVKTNSLLVNLNEIKEVDETDDQGRKKFQSNVAMGRTSMVIYEDSKEQTSGKTPSQNTAGKKTKR